MSRYVECQGLRALISCLLVVFAASLGLAWAELDLVVLVDGSEVNCRVLGLDAKLLTIEREDGRHEKIAREKLVSITFGEGEAAPISARVRVLAADDLVRIYLNGQEVASAAELRAGWVDLAPLLGEGPNELYAEVSNETNLWAYRWVLEANGRRETFQCGLVHKSGCRAEGRSDRALGTFPAGRAWLYVHRRSGEVTIELP